MCTNSTALRACAPWSAWHLVPLRPPAGIRVPIHRKGSPPRSRQQQGLALVLPGGLGIGGVCHSSKMPNWLIPGQAAVPPGPPAAITPTLQATQARPLKTCSPHCLALLLLGGLGIGAAPRAGGGAVQDVGMLVAVAALACRHHQCTFLTRGCEAPHRSWYGGVY